MASGKKEIFENLKRVGAALAVQLSPACEVVIHDLASPENSIVFIGGNVTGRQIGGPMTDFVLGVLQHEPKPEDVVGYMARTRDGKTLKSSTIFIRDRTGRPIGVFCINFDVTHILETVQQLGELGTPTSTIEVNKSFSPDVGNLLQTMIGESVRRVLNLDEIPTGNGRLSIEDRQAIIGDLEEQGALRIRNAVPFLAKLFQVSRYTIYKDLQAVRASSAESGDRH